MSNKYIEIDKRRIGPDFAPYIIAEMSANHNGDINKAMKILEMAKECGADAVKLQTYTQDTLTIDCEKPDFKIEGGLWHGRTLYDLYTQAHMPWDWHVPLFEKAKELGITIFSSPFDNDAVDLLEELGAPAYKIASFEAIDLPLIEYVAATGKPVIISTGMANAEEIQEAVETAKNAGCRELLLLHCVSGYPALASDYNLATLQDMANRFSVFTGLSDHTIDNTTAIASVALGACVIEKHVTLDRNGGGPDDSFSLESSELSQLCNDSRVAWESVGVINYQRKESEKNNTVFRRSLYFIKNGEKGDKITSDMVKSIRPGYGFPPKHLSAIIGKKLLRDVEVGDRVDSKAVRLDVRA